MTFWARCFAQQGMLRHQFTFSGMACSERRVTYRLGPAMRIAFAGRSTNTKLALYCYTRDSRQYILAMSGWAQDKPPSLQQEAIVADIVYHFTSTP